MYMYMYMYMYVYIYICYVDARHSTYVSGPSFTSATSSIMLANPSCLAFRVVLSIFCVMLMMLYLHGTWADYIYIYVFREWLTTRCPYDLSKILSVVSFVMVMANWWEGSSFIPKDQDIPGHPRTTQWTFQVCTCIYTYLPYKCLLLYSYKSREPYPMGANGYILWTYMKDPPTINLPMYVHICFIYVSLVLPLNSFF